MANLGLDTLERKHLWQVEQVLADKDRAQLRRPGRDLLEAADDLSRVHDRLVRTNGDVYDFGAATFRGNAEVCIKTSSLML